MFSTNFFFIFFVLILCGINTLGALKKDWDYKVVSSEMIVKTPKTIQAWVKMTRISRGNYGLSANVTLLKGDFGETGFVELEAYRSPRNDGDYQRLPFKLSKTPFFKFMNEQYKSLIMDSIRDCSNAPVFDDGYDKTLKEGLVLTFNNCLFKDNDATPAHFQPGFYKLVGKATRDPDLDIAVVIVSEVFPSI